MFILVRYCNISMVNIFLDVAKWNEMDLFFRLRSRDERQRVEKNVKYEWRKNYKRIKPDWMKTGNDWSTPELCCRDSSVTQVVFLYVNDCKTLRAHTVEDKRYRSTQIIKNNIVNFSCQVASALNDEIRRLSLLVEEFDRPFHPDVMLLNVYKKV
jgi:hypothetical protein